jgi:hypothetical protein
MRRPAKIKLLTKTLPEMALAVKDIMEHKLALQREGQPLYYIRMPLVNQNQQRLL